MQSNWSFSDIWNSSLLTFGEKPLLARDYIYASELGKPMIDRYLKMLGSKPSNPPTPRSLRKFQAGNIYEGVIHYVLMRCGIMKATQVRAEVTLPDCFKVSGKMDFIAGGEIDWDKAQYEIEELNFFPEFIRYANRKILDQLKEIYQGIEFIYKMLEVKSLSDRMFQVVEKTQRPINTHKLQLFHYVFGGKINGVGIENGDVIYVSREDCQMLEFPIHNSDPVIFQEYQDDIRTITGYVKNKELPPKPQEIIFDLRDFRFNKNIEIEYSYYLTKIYKYKTPDEYREKWMPKVNQFNRVFRRILNGDAMTKANKMVIDDIKQYFPDFDDYVVKARDAGVTQNDDDATE